MEDRDIQAEDPYDEDEILFTVAAWVEHANISDETDAVARKLIKSFARITADASPCVAAYYAAAARWVSEAKAFLSKGLDPKQMVEIAREADRHPRLGMMSCMRINTSWALLQRDLCEEAAILIEELILDSLSIYHGLRRGVVGPLEPLLFHPRLRPHLTRRAIAGARELARFRSHVGDGLSLRSRLGQI